MQRGQAPGGLEVRIARSLRNSAATDFARLWSPSFSAYSASRVRARIHASSAAPFPYAAAGLAVADSSTRRACARLSKRAAGRGGNISGHQRLKRSRRPACRIRLLASPRV
jgi:hypothetical protein